MATTYMRIDKLDSIKGAASVEEINGKKGFMKIDTVSWGMSRHIYMDVGANKNPDSGSFAFQDVSVARTSDGASAYLTTFFFAPGDKGRTVEIMFTKTNRNGDGLVPSLIITLSDARVSNYQLSGGSGGETMESFSLFYSQYEMVYYSEDENGKIVKDNTVKFDLGAAKLLSKANLPA